MMWWERLQKIMSSKNIFPAELARKASIHEKLIYKYLDGKVDNPRGDTMQKLARALDVSEQELRFGLPEGHFVQLKKIPLLDMNKIGTLTKSDSPLDVWDGMSVVSVPSGDLAENAFGVRLTDDSNAPGFKADEIVICEPSVLVDPGKYVVAVVEKLSAGVFRRFRPQSAFNPDVFDLVAEHSDYPPITVDKDNPGFVVARATRHIRNI